MHCAWLIYGSLNQPTGGYVYDRLVANGLRTLGHRVDVLDLTTFANTHDVLVSLRAGQYDCVVGDELCHPELAGLFDVLRRERANVREPRLVLLVHHLQASETGRMVESEQAAIEHADLVITTSHTTAQQVLHWANVPSMVCEPGADRLQRVPRPARHEGALVFLFVGTWTERKGLLRALEYLRHLTDTDFRFHVVGDASREPSYAASVRQLLGSEKWLRQRTQVHGVVTDAELASIYASSDILLLPSRYEGYGMVLSEALYAGVAVIVADVGATHEVVRHERDGLLLPADDSDRWVDTLRQIANRQVAISEWACGRRQLPTWASTVRQFADALGEA